MKRPPEQRSHLRSGIIKKRDMPQYMVTMDMATADSLLLIDQLLGVIQESILPSVERLIELKAQRKVVTGGYPVGQRAIVFIIEADSEKEL